ncbi:hypothetical protein NBRC3280_0687 [Acetobacter pasteurianus NBRC 3280]|nr:hypothetical protein NBRC3280_0687 [Acetobacter pasteurianus NBRC 3280]
MFTEEIRVERLMFTEEIRVERLMFTEETFVDTKVLWLIPCLHKFLL